MSNTSITEPVAPAARQANKKSAQDALTIQVAGFTLPPSNLCSEQTITRLARAKQELQALAENPSPEMANVLTAPLEDIPDIRQREAEMFYNTASYQYIAAHYPTTLEVATIAGVYTETFTPKAGIAAGNKNRVLINIHGGAFIGGSRSVSHLESMPIAAQGNIKVVSIDYRMAPEYHFPAATDDIVAVYQALLEQYSPDNIGIYGCSAGAVLTAETMVRLQQNGLPQPGAVAMSCASAHGWDEGDSRNFVAALDPDYLADGVTQNNIYFKHSDANDPQMLPGKHPEYMAQFPPSLLLVGTRDFAMSSVVKTHSELVRLGVPADLHMWEGMKHAFLYDGELPESEEAYQVMVGFFDRHLGRASV